MSAARLARSLLSLVADTHAKEAIMKLERIRNSKGRIGYALLWLVGVPLPIVLALYVLLH